MRLSVRRSYLLVWAIVFAVRGPYAIAQTAADIAPLKATAARNDLIQSFQAESRRGTSAFYTQEYRLRRRRVEFQGSIFGVIQDVQADGCELKIKSALFDLYSGSIGRKLVGQTQNKYITSVDFKLTPKMAADLNITYGRPMRQLAEGTNAVCSGGRPCNLTWLKVKADAPVILMTEVTNDVTDYDGDIKDFDGPVDQFLLPVSSAAAGEELIAKMRVFAQSCVH